jgi:hypothetical protein
VDASAIASAKAGGSSAEARSLLQLPAARIIVLNGSTEANIATRTANDLSADGFDIVAVGNAERADYEESWLIVHGAAPQAVTDALTQRFGIAADHIRSDSDSTDADLTLIVGADLAAPPDRP